MMLDNKIITDIIARALAEDISDGDITTAAIFDKDMDATTKARFLFKEDGVLAGLPIVEKIFSSLDSLLSFKILYPEGEYIKKGTVVAVVEGKMSVLLQGERTALNFLQHLSGIATKTKEYVDAVKGYHVSILDTRKTTPNLRYLEKYAVKMGGGENYRFGLYDMVMIKDNHIKAAGGITPAVKRVLNKYNNKYFITVEVSNLEELKEVLPFPIDRVMLDNMDTEMIQEAIAIVNGKIQIEVSGGITPQRAKELAPTGVHYISTGAVTNRSISLDISMKFISE